MAVNVKRFKLKKTKLNINLVGFGKILVIHYSAINKDMNFYCKGL